MTRLAKSAALVGVGMAAFATARLALFVAHGASFADLTTAQLGAAFLNGIRFDAVVLLAAQALPLAMMNLPVRAFGKRWFDAWAWLGFAVLVPLVLLLGADVAYFGHVERHISDELAVIGSDVDFVVGQAFRDYLPALVAVGLGAVALASVWRRVLRAPLAPGRHPVAAFLALAVVVALGTRGTLDRKPLGLIDAYQSGGTSFGNLSLNGAFSALHAWRGSGRPTAYAFMDEREAYAALGLSATAPYPVLRRSEGARPTGRNVVLLLLESWDPRYLDSYSERGDGARRGITPRFDEIAEQSLRFGACYAMSQRSVDSVQALLTGVPAIAGEPSLGWGLRLSRITELGNLARAHGYQTLFVQSSKRRSYRLDSAARSLGFEHVYGQEDVPRGAGRSGDRPKWGWDDETLMFALDRINAFGAPFVATVFTGSTHVPYADPGERFHLRPQATSGEDGFVNLLHYSDWALGEFMDAARAESWFQNTVFVLTSDHTFRKAAASGDLREHFRVPFLLYAPGAIAPGVDSRVCSHLDGLPTVLDLLGFDVAYATLGDSLLGKRRGFALVKQGSIMGIISESASLTHSLEGRLAAASYVHAANDSAESVQGVESVEGVERDGPTDPAVFDALERRLLSAVQVTHSLLRENRWAPKP